MFGFASKPLKRLNSRKGIIWIPLPLAWIPLPRTWIPFPRALIGFRRAWIGVGVTATAPSMPNCSQPPPRRPFGRPTRRPLAGLCFPSLHPCKGRASRPDRPKARKISMQEADGAELWPFTRTAPGNAGGAGTARIAGPRIKFREVHGDRVVMPRAGRYASLRSAKHAQVAKERFRQRPASPSRNSLATPERRKSAGAPLSLKPRSARRAGLRRRPSPSTLSDRFRRAKCEPWPRPRHP